MTAHEFHSDSEIRRLIRKGELLWAGNIRDKIYGRLTCSSGKRMKKVNRVFFSSEEEAIRLGFRPCGHCFKDKYLQWKS